MASDEAVHQFQLNRKQVVFLFMATTVACVVIFLCGVIVGRGVRTSSGAIADLAAAADPTGAASAPVGRALATDVTSAIPPPPPALAGSGPVQETLTYPDRLEDAVSPRETLAAPEPPTNRTVARVPPPAAAPSASSSPPAGASPDPGRVEPAGNGYVVQVAAVRKRSEAEAIATRLSSKGYPTFVTSSGAGTPRFFRVRVGKYADRRQAEAIANRLRTEEQFKPWITK